MGGGASGGQTAGHIGHFAGERLKNLLFGKLKMRNRFAGTHFLHPLGQAQHRPMKAEANDQQGDQDDKSDLHKDTNHRIAPNTPGSLHDIVGIVEDGEGTLGVLAAKQWDGVNQGVIIPQPNE